MDQSIKQRFLEIEASMEKNILNKYKTMNVHGFPKSKYGSLEFLKIMLN